MTTAMPATAEVDTPRRALRISAYVGLSLPAVLDLFEDDGINRVVEAALADAAGPGRTVEAHVTRPVRVSAGTARAQVTWRITGRSGRASTGEVDLSMFVVQSGADPLTELLATLHVAADERDVVRVAHDVLDDLATRLPIRRRAVDDRSAATSATATATTDLYPLRSAPRCTEP